MIKDKRKRKEYFKRYYLGNKEKYKEYSKKQRQKKEYKEYQKKYQKKYHKSDKFREYLKKYRKANREKIRKINRKSYHKNKRKYQERQRKYRKTDESKKQVSEFRREYHQRRKKNDKNYLIRIRLRNRLKRVFDCYIKTGKIMSAKEYGIDYKAIIEHLKPFPKDLSNYQIHHIKPLYTFKFVNKDGSTNLKEVSKAFSPKNHKLITEEKHNKIHKKGTKLL